MRKSMRQKVQKRAGRIGAAQTVRGFTMIEILIVVAILGIAAAIVLPKFSNASQTARDNVLKDELRYLRTQIVVFKAQHRDVPPGYPGGNVMAVPSAAEFVQQMTKNTDERCNVGAPSQVFHLGPYLSKMPPNPINALDTVIVVAGNAAMPAPDNSTGWIYKPQTLEIIPNLPGMDSNGVRYSDY